MLLLSIRVELIDGQDIDGLMAHSQGCRDPKLLDRRDARKYRGSKHKTASKKQSRVGQAGKERRQRGQWRPE